jgi:phosphatidyl-myo-inositol dimannoside synthase
VTKPVTVLLLDTFSVVGGLQKFNQRIIRNISERACEKGDICSEVLILRDLPCHLPKSNSGITFKAFGTNKIGFLIEAARSVLAGTSAVLIGHINLAPCAVLAKLIDPSVRTFLFVHGVEVWNNKRYRRRRWYDHLCIRDVDTIISVSDYTFHKMADQFSVPRSKYLRIPNAVDLAEVPSFNPAGARSPTILSVSRLSEGDREKHVDKLIRAISIVVQQVPKVRLDIVGDGPLRSELEALAVSIGVEQVVRFCGLVSDSELQLAYGSASVFAMPSSKEGFGIVYLEAWNHRLPVLCSNDGAASEIVEDGVDGFIVNANDECEIAEKIILLLKRPDLACKMGQVGRKKVELEYSASVFKRNLDVVLDEIVKE